AAPARRWRPGEYRLSLLLTVRIDVVNRLLHGGDLFGLFVGDLGLEFIFERHDQLNHIERIGTEVVKEGGLVLDLGFVDAKLFSDDLLDALFDAFHADLQLGKITRIIAKRRGMPTPGRDKNDCVSLTGRSGTALLHIHAAVDVQCDSGYVFGLGARYKGPRMSDVNGRPQPPQRDLLRQRGGLVFAQ